MSFPLKGRDLALPFAILVAALGAIGYTAWRAGRAQGDSDLALRRMYAAAAAAFVAERVDLTLAALADMAILLPDRRGVDADFIERAWRKVDSLYRCRCTKLPRPLATFAVSAPGAFVRGDSTQLEHDVRQLVTTLFADGMPMSRRDSTLVVYPMVRVGRAYLVMARGSTSPAPRGYVGLVADASTLDLKLLDYREHVIADPGFFGSLGAGPPAHTPATAPPDSLLAFALTTLDGQPFARSAAPFADGALDATLRARSGGFEVQAWTSPRAGPLLLNVVTPSRRGDVAAVSILGTVLIVGLFMVLLRAAALARLRQQLALGVTHELRTPLTQILLYAETLAMGRARSTDAREKAVAVIVRETQFLIDSVDNVLHHTRAEERELSTTPESLDVADLVTEILETRTSATTTTAIAPGTRVHADQRLLTRVVVNLVDNAMKHGGGHVHISSHQHGGTVELYFDDVGPGVRPGLRRQVFAPFFRAEDARHRPGFGMGLALVADAVRAMAGTVSIGDAPSGGARVRVTLPKGRSAA